MWLYRSSMKLEQNRKAIEGKILVSFLWDHWQVQDGIRTTKTRPPWKISRSPICFLYLSNSRLKLGTVVGLVLGSSLYPAAQLSMSVWRFPPWKRCRAFFTTKLSYHQSILSGSVDCDHEWITTAHYASQPSSALCRIYTDLPAKTASESLKEKSNNSPSVWLGAGYFTWRHLTL